MGVVVFGSANMDMVLSVRELPVAGETVTARGLARLPGGKGANQAIASARFGVPTAFFGAVGDDEYGQEIEAFLSRNGVATDGLSKIANTVTGQAYVCVSDRGENAIVVVPGANHAIRGSGFASAAAAECNVYLTQFEVDLNEVARFLSSADPSSIRIVNCAPAVPVGEGDFEFGSADILVMNESELSAYSGLDVTQATGLSITNAARTLLSRDDQTIVVTLGRRGVLLVGAKEAHLTPAKAVTPVDTTGAGDCFCGVLAACLSEGQSLLAAVETANAAAAISITRPGAAPSMPYRDEVLSLGTQY